MKRLILILSLVFMPISADAAVELATPTFDTFVSQGKTLVEFYKPGCPWCEKSKPVVEAFEKANKNIQVGKVNGDIQTELRTKYALNSSPSYLLFDKGKLIGQRSGYMPIEALSAWVENPTVATKSIGSSAPGGDGIKAAIYDKLVARQKIDLEIIELERQLNS